VNDERVTQNDYLNAIARELGVQPPTRHIPYRLAVMLGATAELVAHATHMSQPPIMRYGLQLSGGENRFDISRARRDLGFTPRVMLTEGVRESVNWYRAAELLTVA
jgi:nucleoside-diphosphate-sugar epimerase